MHQKREWARGRRFYSSVLVLFVALPVATCAAPAATPETDRNEAAPGASSRRPWLPGVGAAISYAGTRAGDIGFAIVDGSRPAILFGHEARRSVPGASVMKVMFLAAYLRHPSVRGRELTDDDRALLEPMIRWSDNATATRIADFVGAERIYGLARRAGMNAFRYTRPWGLSSINPAEQARFMLTLERYIPKRHRPYARYLLSHVVRPQRWGVAEVKLPKGWKLFFKSGWATGTGRVSHQVALLEKGRRRVALAVTTEYSPDHAYSTDTLRGIAARLLRGLR